MLFGDFLRECLRETRVRDLADAIHVEQSVVYRWLRNERAPRLSSAHIANIALYLRLDARRLDQLKQAQLTSLELPAPPGGAGKKRRPATRQDRQAAVRRFLEHTHADLPSPPSGGGAGRGAGESRRPRAISAQSSPVRGRLAVTHRAIELLESAPACDPEQGGSILLSMQGKKTFEGLPDAQGVQNAWQAALRQVLRRGWRIEQLWRLDRNVDRSVRLVETMLDLVGSGRYWPRYFDRYGVLDPPYDVLVVPGHAAMLSLATDEPEADDAAFVFARQEEIALVAGHFRRLREHTKPLLRGFFPRTQEIDYTRALVAGEGGPGGRLSIKHGPSGLTYPPHWWRPETAWARVWVESGLVAEGDLPEYLECLQARFRQFQRFVRDHDYRDVCSRRGLDELAESGRYDYDDPQSGQDASPQMRLEHLRNIVDMLKTYDRYHLALLDPREEREIPTIPAREVAGGDDAFIGTWSRDASEAAVTVALHITEPTIVSALREHLDDLWGRIAEGHREKRYVIAYLERHIAALEGLA